MNSYSAVNSGIPVVNKLSWFLELRYVVLETKKGICLASNKGTKSITSTETFKEFSLHIFQLVV